MIIGRPIAKLLDIVTGITAVFAVICLALYFINLKFPFIKNVDAIAKFIEIKDIVLYVVIGLCSLQFALRRSIIFFILYIILAGVTIGFMFAAGVF